MEGCGSEAPCLKRPSARDHRGADPDDPGRDADYRGFEERESGDCPQGRTAGAEESLVGAATLRATGGKRCGEQPGQHGTRETEEQEERLGVEGVAARCVERGAEVVADGTGSRESDFEVARFAGDGGERGRGIARQAVIETSVNLGVDLVRVRRGERIEEPVPEARGKKQHVVGWSLGLSPRRKPDFLEERVGLGKIDDAIDANGDGFEPGTADRDGVADASVQVRGGLLGEEHTIGRPEERTDLSGKCCSIAGGKAEHDSCPRALHGPTGGGSETGRGSEVHGLGCMYACVAGDCVRDRRGVGAWRGLHLPVDGDDADRPLCHRCFRSAQEAAQRREHGDGERDAERHGREPTGPTNQPAHPGHAEH